MDEGRLEAAVLEHLREAAGDDPPVVVRRFRLGSSGWRADLAILEDVFIGVAVRGRGDSLQYLADEMAVLATYFDHIMLVVDESVAVDVEVDRLSGAAVWSLADDGLVAELSPGSGRTPGFTAWFDLLPPEPRRRLLQPLLAMDPVPARGESAIPLERVREAAEASIRARHRADSDAFWTAVAGRAIAPADVVLLEPEALPPVYAQAS